MQQLKGEKQLAIIRLLQEKGTMSQIEIREETGYAQSSVSYILNRLKELKIIGMKRRGKSPRGWETVAYIVNGQKVGNQNIVTKKSLGHQEGVGNQKNIGNHDPPPEDPPLLPLPIKNSNLGHQEGIGNQKSIGNQKNNGSLLTLPFDDLRPRVHVWLEEKFGNQIPLEYRNLYRLLGALEGNATQNRNEIYSRNIIRKFFDILKMMEGY